MDVLEKENAVLRVQLGMNSKNSHKLPSADVFVKHPALPCSKGKQKGGQKDHKGNTLKTVANLDFTVTHSPLSCSFCNRPNTNCAVHFAVVFFSKGISPQK